MKLIKNNKEIEIEVIELLNNKLIVNKIEHVRRQDKIVFTCSICNNESVFRNYIFNIVNILNCICTSCAREKTNIKKYGSKCNLCNKDQKEKIKQTNLIRYGVENPYQSEEIKEKIKQTNLIRYGAENPYQSEEIKEKIKQTNLTKYSVEHASQSKEIKEKIKQTNLTKYGCYGFNTQKTKETVFSKYGVEYVSQSKEIKEKISASHHERSDEEKSKTRQLKSKSLLYNFYNKLISSHRLKNLVAPLFIIEDYKGVSQSNKYKWLCKLCNFHFLDYLNNGHIPKCPICFPGNLCSSELEKELCDWLKSLNIEIVENDRKILVPYELDIFIPKHNLAIEFDGLYWHSEKQGKHSGYHLMKTNSCKNLGIQLLHIWENEWIEKQNIVKSIIKSKLNIYDRIIYGRKCIVKEISNKEAKDFYFENHIQGSINSKINLGLFYEDELVSCLSFSKPRYNKKYDWEITRFANLLNTKVHGSFGKLWKHRPEGSIITYSDKRYFTGSIYNKYLFQINDSKQAYWYIVDGNIRSRIEFQKYKLKKLPIFDPNLTEWENMQLNGYDRIWDCGNYVFEFKPSF